MDYSAKVIFCMKLNGMQPCGKSALTIEVVRLRTWSQAFRPDGTLSGRTIISRVDFLQSELRVGSLVSGRLDAT